MACMLLRDSPVSGRPVCQGLTCSKTTVPAATLRLQVTSLPVDLVFIYDRSGSMSNSEVQDELDFMVLATEIFDKNVKDLQVRTAELDGCRAAPVHHRPRLCSSLLTSVVQGTHGACVCI